MELVDGLSLIKRACLLRLAYRLKVSHVSLIFIVRAKTRLLKVEHWGLVAEAAKIFRREVLSDEKSCRNNVGKFVNLYDDTIFTHFHCTGIEGFR